MKRKILVLTLFCLLFVSANVCASEKGSVRLVQNGNYMSFEPEEKLKPVRVDVAEAAQNLPTEYDLRDVDGKSYVDPPGYQNPWNNCWSFAATGAAESNALLDGAPSANFSNRALTWYSYQLQSSQGVPSSVYEGIELSSSDPTILLPFEIGGDPETAFQQMTTWNGASTSAEVPYQNDQGLTVDSGLPGVIEYSPEGTWALPYSDIYDNAYHLQNYNTLTIDQDSDPSIEEIENVTKEAKRLLMDNGALALGFGMYDDSEYFNENTWTQYVPTPEGVNHAVSIVGWDDNFAVDNFNSKNLPPGPGAWICKNSWSSAWGDGGYFYLSFYDRTISTLSSLDVEEGQGYTYDNNLQYDFLGNKAGLSKAVCGQLGFYIGDGGFNPHNLKAANVFEVDNKEMLEAVSAYTIYNTPTQVTTSIYSLDKGYSNPEDGTLLLTQTDDINNCGLTTLELDVPIPLSEGETFSVVQNIIYNDLIDSEGNFIEQQACLPLEFGTNKAFTQEQTTEDGESVEISFDYKTHVIPGTSYICGVVKENPTKWYESSDQNVQHELGIPLTFILGVMDFDIMAVPGNAMIKAYTTNVDSPPAPPEVPATGITVNDGSDTVYLATEGDGATTSTKLTAALTPADSTDPITWSIATDSVATLSAVSGSTVTLNAVSEGETTVTVDAGEATTTLNVIVNNNKVLADELIISATQPDYYSVDIENLRANPALNLGDENVEKVSIFNWSEPNQDDMNAKVAERVPNTKNWNYINFPVNDNAINNYFIFADEININIYASTDASEEGELIGAGQYSWMNRDSAGQTNSVGYIGYSENRGFDKPTVFDGATAGTVGRGLHLEGIRVSSNIEGATISSRVHVQDLGWLNVAGDGTYNGTMHRDLGIEAVVLYLDGAEGETLQYRVHQENRDWTPWVLSGEEAGSTGQNIQIDAIEIQMVPST